LKAEGEFARWRRERQGRIMEAFSELQRVCAAHCTVASRAAGLMCVAKEHVLCPGGMRCC
jgi:hypothetical protein